MTVPGTRIALSVAIIDIASQSELLDEHYGSHLVARNGFHIKPFTAKIILVPHTLSYLRSLSFTACPKVRTIR
jgi:hypothetical protein